MALRDILGTATKAGAAMTAYAVDHRIVAVLLTLVSAMPAAARVWLYVVSAHIALDGSRKAKSTEERVKLVDALGRLVRRQMKKSPAA